jgi:hypothetical protein
MGFNTIALARAPDHCPQPSTTHDLPC